MRQLIAAIVIAAGLAGSHPVRAETPIGVSYQPALYWAFPFYVATEMNWWKDAGLAPTFSVFPAGAPQVAAAQAKSWDVGGTGSVPAVLGAARSGLLTIGLTNDESKTNVLIVRDALHDALKANPRSIKGQKVLLTTNSTVDYAVRNCLKSFGLESRDVQFVNLGQAQIISAMTSNNGDLAGVWAPYTYTLEEKAGAKTLCTGADAGAVVPGVLVVRSEYAKEKPHDVAIFLATYLRAWGWAQSHPAEARTALKKFYTDGGVEISDAAVDKEFALRPVFNLTQQLAAMNRGAGPSQLDGWIGKIVAFMVETGTLPRAPAVGAFITDEYMRIVANDPKLRAFATEFDPK